MPQLDPMEDFINVKAGNVWGFPLGLLPRVVEYCRTLPMPVHGLQSPVPLEDPPSILVARGHSHCSVCVVHEGKACMDSLNLL